MANPTEIGKLATVSGAFPTPSKKQAHSLSDWMNWVTLNFDALSDYGISPYEFEAIINRRRLNEKISEAPAKIEMTAEQLFEAIVIKGRAVSEREKWTSPFSERINTRILKLLCLYFTGDPKMEKYGLYPQKGIWLEGPRGCGKTIIMKLLSCNPSGLFEGQVLNPVCNFRFTHTQQVQTMIDEGTSPNFYANPSENDKRFFYKTSQKFAGWCIDDVGAERMGKYNINRVADVLSIIERTQKGNYNHFHITTNLDDEEFGRNYGGRLVSRKYEMFNVLTFDKDAPDLRIHKVNVSKEVDL